MVGEGDIDQDHVIDQEAFKLAPRLCIFQLLFAVEDKAIEFMNVIQMIQCRSDIKITGMMHIISVYV